MLIHVPVYFPYTFTGPDYAEYLAELALVTLESYFTNGNTHDVLVTTNHALAYQMFWDYRRVSGRQFEIIFVTRKELTRAFGCEDNRLDDAPSVKMLFSKFYPVFKGFDDRIVHIDLDTLFTTRVDFEPLFASAVTLVDANRFLVAGHWAPEPLTARFFGVDLGRSQPVAKWVNSGVFAVQGSGFELCRQAVTNYLRRLDQAHELVGCDYPDELMLNALAVRESRAVTVIPDHTYNFLVYFLIHDPDWLRHCQILHFHGMKPLHASCADGQLRYDCPPEHTVRMNAAIYPAMALYFWYLHAACRGLDYNFIVRDRIPWSVVEREHRRLMDGQAAEAREEEPSAGARVQNGANGVHDEQRQTGVAALVAEPPAAAETPATEPPAVYLAPRAEGELRCYAWSHAHAPELDLLLRSSSNHEVPIEIIGLGMNTRNLLFKIESLYWIACSLPDHTLVVCSDGFDVLYTQGVDAIRKKFRTFHAPLVFSAERCYSHQFPEHRAHYERSGNGSPYRYLNTGCLIGYAKAIRDMLAEVRTYDVVGMRDRFGSAWFCDQTLISRYVVEHPDEVALDRGCDLFWCVAGDWDAISDVAAIGHSGLANTITGTFPALVHVPFRERYNHVLDYLARGLGYA